LEINLKGARIMIVDDEHILANMMTDYLSMHGAHIKTFHHPLLALDAFRQHFADVDLVITDETMPSMTGMEMAKKMLAIKPGLPIILCTGYSKQATPEASSTIGIRAHFNKPVSMVELVLKIKSLLAAK
jgi:DNA-binding NtrC family response regulator